MQKKRKELIRRIIDQMIDEGFTIADAEMTAHELLAEIGRLKGKIYLLNIKRLSAIGQSPENH